MGGRRRALPRLNKGTEPDFAIYWRLHLISMEIGLRPLLEGEELGERGQGEQQAERQSLVEILHAASRRSCACRRIAA